MNETQKRLRRQFVLPNEIFDLGLSGGEILVYAFLIRCEDRETYTCYPSYDTIGSAVGMSRNTVGKYVSLLEHNSRFRPVSRARPSGFFSRMGQNMSREWVRKWVSPNRDSKDGADDTESENRSVKCTKGVFRRDPVSVRKWVRSILRTDYE